MFPAGSAAEIIARNQDGRSGKLRIVKEIARLLTQSLKRAFAQTSAADGFQPSGRNDDIGFRLVLLP